MVTFHVCIITLLRQQCGVDENIADAEAPFSDDVMTRQTRTHSASDCSWVRFTFCGSVTAHQIRKFYCEDIEAFV